MASESVTPKGEGYLKPSPFARASINSFEMSLVKISRTNDLGRDNCGVKRTKEKRGGEKGTEVRGSIKSRRNLQVKSRGNETKFQMSTRSAARETRPDEKGEINKPTVMKQCHPVG